jgi:hypothetical protein
MARKRSDSTTGKKTGRAPLKILFGDVPLNGRVGKGEVCAVGPDGTVYHTDRINPMDDAERRRFARAAAEKTGRGEMELARKIDAAWNRTYEKHRRDQKAAAASPGSPRSPGSQYQVEGGRLCLRGHSARGDEYRQPLCNFDAHITREEVLDDGSGEERHTFAVEGRLDDGTPLPAAAVPAADFAAMSWCIKAWGLRAVVFAGMGVRDHLRVAIQERSAGAARHRIYKHTGWRQEGDAWLYLHNGGAVGAAGTVRSLRVELEGKLQHYSLPDPPRGKALAEAARADLRLLGLARPRLMYPLLGATYRSVLGPADCSVALIGRTGLGKSEVVALWQQHFGAAMHRRNLPGNWSSTANALESLAFLAKDALLVIDDFKPGGSRSEVDQLHVKAERVLRAQANSSARQRCWVDGTVRADRPPRGLIVMTAEDQVRGESLRARQLPLLVRPDDLDVRALTPFQQDAAGGMYAQALAGFVQWLAPQYAQVRERLAKEHAGLRVRAQGSQGHPRTPGIVADLALGLHYFLDFAVAAGAVTPQVRGTLADAGWHALLEAAADQAQEVRAQDPARRFLQLVSAAVTSERAHLAARNGGAPDDAAAWGWRLVTFGAGENQHSDWQPQGRLIGWVEGEELYLDPEAAFAEAQRLADDQGDRLPLSQHQLYRRLKEQGLLASTEPNKTTNRRTLQSKERSVLHLRRRQGLPPSQKQGEQGEQGDVP